MSALGPINSIVSDGKDVSTIKQPEPRWLRSAQDICANIKAQPYLLRGLLPQESLAMLFGQSGSCKSFIALGMAACIASEDADWMSIKTMHGPVVVIAGEGHYGVATRIKAWAEHFNLPVPARLFISASGTDLDSPVGREKVITEIEALPERPVLIVVDTLHRNFAGNENSAEDTKRMIDACEALQQKYRATVMLVHHTGVNPEAQERGRGSSAWRAAMDAEFCTISPDGQLGLKTTKLKDGEPLPPIFFKLHKHELSSDVDLDGEPIKSAVLLPNAYGGDPDLAARNAHLDQFYSMWEQAGFTEHNGYPLVPIETAKQYFLDQGKAESTVIHYAKADKGGALFKLQGMGLCSFVKGVGTYISDDTQSLILNAHRDKQA